MIADESRDMNTADRSNYKETWEQLSETHYKAMMNIAGHEDKEEFERSARVTLGVLDETVGVRDSDTFLEIGCGIGRVGRVLSPLVEKWIGTDISSGMTRQAGEYLQEFSNTELVTLGDPDLSEIPDQSVDVVYCTVVFMHLFEWDRYKYVQEAFRILKPGGRCYFDNMDIKSDHGWEVFEFCSKYPLDGRPPQIGMTSSGDELEVYGEKAGFENIRIHRWGGAWVALVGQKPL